MACQFLRRSICVLAVAAFGLFVCKTEQAVAQQPAILVEDVSPAEVGAIAVQAFLRECGNALSDPGGFIEAAPGRNQPPAHMFSRSPDDQIVQLNFALSDLPAVIDTYFIGVPGALRIHCSAQYVDLSEIYDGSASTAIPASERARVAGEALAAEFEAATGTAVVGGLIVPDPLSADNVLQALGPGDLNHYGTYAYAAFIPLGGVDAFVELGAYSTGSFGVTLSVSHLVEAEDR